MYTVSISENLTVENVFNTEIYVDSDVTTYPITEAEKDMISQSGRMDLWQYKNGKVVESEFAADILKNQFNAQQKQKRQSAYQKESDPLFMKYQRGEATKEEWESKVAEIVARYPYQE
jgi:ABC-type lipoprotein release transport system permease subunit